MHKDFSSATVKAPSTAWKRGAWKEETTQWFSLKEMATVSQVTTGTVSHMKHIWAFPSTLISSWTELNWTCQVWNVIKLRDGNTDPSKHAGSDPEAFMAITASVQPESGWIVHAESDFQHPFQFRFSKDGMGHTAQNRPGSDLDGLVRVWPNTSGLEASRCAGITWPGFWQDATGPLPVSHFHTLLRSSTDVLDNVIQNQPGSDLALADCVSFWPKGSSPEASQCEWIIRPDSGQCLPAEMWIRSGTLTGITPAYGVNETNWKAESPFEAALRPEDKGKVGDGFQKQRVRPVTQNQRVRNEKQQQQQQRNTEEGQKVS